MNKKILIQFFLFSLFIFLSVFFYYEYFKKDSQILKKNNIEKNLLALKDDIKKKLEIEAIWNEFIFTKYKDQVKIDEDK